MASRFFTPGAGPLRIVGVAINAFGRPNERSLLRSLVSFDSDERALSEAPMNPFQLFVELSTPTLGKNGQNPAAPNQENPSGTNWGLIIGIILGVFLILLTCCCIGCCCLCKHHRRMKSKPPTACETAGPGKSLAVAEHEDIAERRKSGTQRWIPPTIPWDSGKSVETAETMETTSTYASSLGQQMALHAFD